MKIVEINNYYPQYFVFDQDQVNRSDDKNKTLMHRDPAVSKHQSHDFYRLTQGPTIIN